MNKITVLKPGDPRRTMEGAGDVYYFLAAGNETDGQYFMMEGLVPPGGGPPPHVQTREEEAFYILEGEVTFYAEGKEVVAPKGSYLNIPKGVRHRFRNNTERDARMLISFSPAGIEAMFDEMGGNEEQFAKHPDGFLAALNEIGEKYGTQFFEEDEAAEKS